MKISIRYQALCIWLLISCLFNSIPLTRAQQLSAINRTYPKVSLEYNRIKLIIPSNQFIDFQQHKTLIDSVFSFIDIELQKTELQIGYKISSDIEFQLFESLDDYSDQLSKTKFYQEQHGINNFHGLEKVLPLYIAQSFYRIKSDIKFLVSYYLLDEFLHGVGVKQRLNQADAVRLPMWLIHGFCLMNSTAWNIKDIDEYLYFQQSGSYKRRHQIPAEAQPIFGKYIWSHIFSNYNKNTISTIWFTVKYTNQLNDAFLFQFKKDFEEWYAELPKITLPRYNKRWDIENHPSLKGKIIQQVASNDSNTWLLHLSDESNHFIGFRHADGQYKWVVRQPRIISSISGDYIEDFQVIFNSETNRFEYSYRNGCKIVRTIFNKDLSIGPKIIEYTSITAINQGETPQLKQILKLKSLDFLNSSSNNIIQLKISKLNNSLGGISYCLVTSIKALTSFGNVGVDANSLFFLHIYKFQDTLVELLRVDTFNALPIIGSFLVESADRISYTTPVDGQWRLNFIEFSSDSDLLWNTGYVSSYFRHFRDVNGRLIEVGYQGNSAKISIYDNWIESKQDIIRLYKQPTTKEAADTIKLVTIVPNLADTGFRYIGKFPYKSWTEKINNQLINYYSGEFQTRSIGPSYYLKHAGVYLSNYENRSFSYVYLSNLSNLINSPFTPILRLTISDKLGIHKINSMMYSNIVGSRMGLEFDQKIKLNSKLEFLQSLWWRNRNFLTDENNLIRHASIFGSVGLSRQWSKLITSTALSSLRYDQVFPRLSNLSQPSLINQKSLIIDGHMRVSMASNPYSTSSIKRWNYQVDALVGTSYFMESKTANLAIELTPRLSKFIGKHLMYNGRGHARYSWGKSQTLYLMGGTDGWISNQQFIDKLPSIKSEVLYPMLGFALPIRGFQYGSRIGSSFIGIQQQVEYNVFKHLINNQIRNIFISDFTIYSFYDLGLAFIGKTPSDIKNPYNTKRLETGNFSLWYSSIQNPWICSFGIGFRTYIMGFPLKYEISIPKMENNWKKTQHLIGLQWEF